MPAPKKPSKKPAQPVPQKLDAIDPAQLDNVTGGCGGQRKHCCGGQQQQVNYYPYPYNPYQQQGQYGGYGAPYDVVTNVDYGNGQQQQIVNGGVPTSGNTYIR